LQGYSEDKIKNKSLADKENITNKIMYSYTQATPKNNS